MSELYLRVFLLAAAASTASFPIRAGIYVKVGIDCRNPANAHMFEYDGKHFSYPHASKCSSTILTRAHGEYRVREVCRANGDGSPAKPFAMMYIYSFPSATQIHMIKFLDGRTDVLDYRLCPGLKLD